VRCAEIGKNEVNLRGFLFLGFHGFARGMLEREPLLNN
jgi:hypothetical protein